MADLGGDQGQERAPRQPKVDRNGTGLNTHTHIARHTHMHFVLLSLYLILSLCYLHIYTYIYTYTYISYEGKSDCRKFLGRSISGFPRQDGNLPFTAVSATSLTAIFYS